MNFNYEQSKSDFEALERCIQTLTDEKLILIAKAALENFTQISITLALPHFLMSESVRSAKYFQYLLEGLLLRKINCHPKPQKHSGNWTSILKRNSKQMQKTILRMAERYLIIGGQKPPLLNKPLNHKLLIP